MNSWRYRCFPSWQNYASGNCKNGPLFQNGGQRIHSKNNTSFHTLEISFAQRFPLKSMMRHNFSLTEAMLFKTEKSRSLELGVWYFLKTNQCSWHGLSWVVEFTLVTNDCALFCIPQNNRIYSSNNLFYFASLPWPWHVMCTGLHITLSFLGSKWCPFNSFVKFNDIGMICFAEDIDLLTLVPQLLVKGGARFRHHHISHYPLTAISVVFVSSWTQSSACKVWIIHGVMCNLCDWRDVALLIARLSLSYSMFDWPTGRTRSYFCRN